jgi:hypothetical protein
MAVATIASCRADTTPLPSLWLWQSLPDARYGSKVDMDGTGPTVCSDVAHPRPGSRCTEEAAVLTGTIASKVSWGVIPTSRAVLWEQQGSGVHTHITVNKTV